MQNPLAYPDMTTIAANAGNLGQLRVRLLHINTAALEAWLVSQYSIGLQVQTFTLSKGESVPATLMNGVVVLVDDLGGS